MEVYIEMIGIKEIEELEKAKDLMSWAHQGQTRAKSGILYEIHPRRVAAMAAEHGFPHYAIIAMLWHDCAEDGPDIIKYNVNDLKCVAIEEYHISTETVNEACKIVDSLTRYQHESKSEYISRLTREGSDLAVLGKVLDRIDNLKDGETSMGDDWLARYSKSTKKIIRMVETRKLTDYACYQHLKNKLDLIERYLDAKRTTE